MIRPLAVLASCALAACSSMASTGAADARPDAESAPRAKASATDELRDLRADLDEATKELAIAKLKSEHAAAAAATKAAMARRDVEIAAKSLERYGEETGIELRDAQLAVDRSTYRLEETRAELAELEAMYQEEEFAKTTKELVLTRGRRQVELAEESLAIENGRLALRRMERDLGRAEKSKHLDEVRLSLSEAEQADLVATLERELEVQRAQRAVDDLQAKIRKHGADS